MIMWLMQGAPGSGKSTAARKLLAEQGAQIVSTDFWFQTAGGYKFDPSYLGEYHGRTQALCRSFLSVGMRVVVDNTNIRRLHAQPYLDMAKEFGYTVIVVRCDGKYQNEHGVPESTVEKMREMMEDISG